MQMVDGKSVYTLEDAAQLKNYAVPTLVAENPEGTDVPLTKFANTLGLQYGFLGALLSSPATTSLFVTENGKRKYRQSHYNCDTGELEVITGKTVHTELPPDIGTACCHTKPDLNGSLTKAKPMRLCLKDCRDDLRDHWLRLIRQGFVLFGGTGAEAEYIAELKAWFTFFQARDIMYGQTDVVGGNIAKFPGVLELMNKSVVSMSALDIVGVFEALSCRFGVLPGNYAFGAHPMVISAIKSAVTRNGNLLKGFSIEGGSLYFEGHKFHEDILVPLDIETGTGQIWVADLNKTGVFMERDLTNPFISTIESYTDSQTGDCFEQCIFLKNYGFAFTRDYNAVLRITDVAIDRACTSTNALYGLGNFISPDTLIPTYA